MFTNEKNFIYNLSIVFASSAIANQPKEWQLGFQNAASEGMRDIVNFHNNLLLPIIIAISVFVLFLMIYASVRFRASRNPNPIKDNTQCCCRGIMDINSMFNS